MNNITDFVSTTMENILDKLPDITEPVLTGFDIESKEKSVQDMYAFCRRIL